MVIFHCFLYVHQRVTHDVQSDCWTPRCKKPLCRLCLCSRILQLHLWAGDIHKAAKRQPVTARRNKRQRLPNASKSRWAVYCKSFNLKLAQQDKSHNLLLTHTLRVPRSEISQIYRALSHPFMSNEAPWTPCARNSSEIRTLRSLDAKQQGRQHLGNPSVDSACNELLILVLGWPKNWGWAPLEVFNHEILIAVPIFQTQSPEIITMTLQKKEEPVSFPIILLRDQRPRSPWWELSIFRPSARPGYSDKELVESSTWKAPRTVFFSHRTWWKWSPKAYPIAIFRENLNLILWNWLALFLRTNFFCSCWLITNNYTPSHSPIPYV